MPEKIKPNMLQFEIPFAVENKTCIYALVDPRTSEIRYVGKAFDPQKRLCGHMRDSVLARYRDKRTSWLKALKSAGLKPLIVILEVVAESEWQECEKKWIAHFRAAGTNLTNTQDGGEGQSKGYRPSPEAIEKTASKLRGRKRDPEVVQRIKEANKGNRPTQEHLEKCWSGNRRWREGMTEEQRLSKMQKMWSAGIAKMAAVNPHGQMGVKWYEERQKWHAYINFNGKRIPLGRFKTFEEAVAVRKAAEVKYFGAETAHPLNS